MFKVQSIEVYGKEKPLVRSATFSIAPTEIVYIEGNNGSGKSSLFRGIFGHPHVQTQNKKISLDNVDISHVSPQELARLKILYIPQHAVILPGVSFVSFTHRAYELIHETTLSILDFTKLCKQKCIEYEIPEYILEKNVHEHLSGGERKLQELVQLVMLQPAYAFIDEIDAGLDQEKQILVARVLQTIAKQGMGLVYTSHSASFTALLPYVRKHVMQVGVLQ